MVTVGAGFSDIDARLELSHDTAKELALVKQVEYIDGYGKTAAQWEAWPATANIKRTATLSISSSMFGVAKHRSPSRFGQVGLGVGSVSGLTRDVDSSSPGVAHGQDRVGMEDVWGDEGKVVGKLLWVNDGHGNLGEKSAAEAAKHLVEQYSLPGKVSEIRGALQQKDDSSVQKIIEDMYKRTSEYLLTALGTSHEGGTTCSHALLIEAGGQFYVVTSNMGDSPVMIVDRNTGEVVHTHGSHNWDNLEEYRLYDRHCQKKGVRTSAAVYNRFNCGNGQLPGPQGDLAPIQIFRRNEQTGEMEVDPTNLEYITEVMAGWGAIGGFQSEARMVLADKVTGETKAPCPGYGHTNWGSVVLLDQEGGAQCTRSFADWAEQTIAHTIGDTPTVSVTAVSKDAVVLVMSDGAADVIGYSHQIGRKVAELCKSDGDSTMKSNNEGNTQGISANRIVQGLGEWILDRGSSTENYGLKNGKPTWDDVTIAGATLAELDLSQPRVSCGSFP